MSDLISRSALIEFVKEELKQDRPYDFKIKNIQRFIEDIPTAYDVVLVEDLEAYRANFDCRFCKYNKTEKAVCTKDCTDALIDGLLDILRKGGVE